MRVEFDGDLKSSSDDQTQELSSILVEEEMRVEFDGDLNNFKAGKSLFVLRNTDFTGDDIASREPCKGGLEEAVRLISVKSGAGRYDTCFALRGGSELVTIQAVGQSEMGNGAKWSTSRDTDLIVCGKDTGHRSKGKMLIAPMDVDCCFGDGSLRRRELIRERARRGQVGE